MPRAADRDVPALLARPSSGTLRTGFGEGTVSPPTTVMHTLGGGLESAERVVPSAREVVDELRASRAGEREARARELEERRAKRPEPPLRNAFAQARDFISALNQSATTARARLSGEAAPATAVRASVQINGQALGFLQAQANADAAATGRLDLLI